MSKFTADIAHYRRNGDHGKELWLNPALWAIASYRLSNWVYVTLPAWPVRIPLKLVLFGVNKFFEICMQMCISPSASIGEGLYIGHIGGVIISQFAVIGRDCDIGHRVTIGVPAMGRPGAPIIGDEVYIGNGATLVGKIRIGNGAKIAANSLVIDDVPEGASVMGVPGRIIIGPAKVGTAKSAQSPSAVASSKQIEQAPEHQHLPRHIQ